MKKCMNKSCPCYLGCLVSGQLGGYLLISVGKLKSFQLLLSCFFCLPTQRRNDLDLDFLSCHSLSKKKYQRSRSRIHFYKMMENERTLSNKEKQEGKQGKHVSPPTSKQTPKCMQFVKRSRTSYLIQFNRNEFVITFPYLSDAKAKCEKFPIEYNPCSSSLLPSSIP